MTPHDPSAIACARRGPRCEARVRLILTVDATVDSMAGDSDAELSDAVEREMERLVWQVVRAPGLRVSIRAVALDESNPAEWSR
jgi:hypothetical protein